ncbi:hypothetical protein ACFQNE_17495 [Gordonia phosphorivorans]|uniref:Recombinase A n=1 Tax=Gordonia phosphorivorans TaxID=1056982 RepID=A0ABV6HA70_9ACTN
MSDQSVDKAATVAALRRRLTQMSGGTDPSRTSQTGSVDGERSTVLAVPTPIADLLPRRGLVPGSVVAVSGAMTLPVALLAAASAAGATAAVVGLPELNLAMAADLGADLGRIAVVESPVADSAVESSAGRSSTAWDRLEAAAVLLDGIDLVLVGIDRVTPSRARVLAGRARRQSATLLVLGPPGVWPGASVRLSAQVVGYRHLPLRRNGYGRIGGLQVDVEAAGTGIAPRRLRCELVTPSIGDAGSLRLQSVEPARRRSAVSARDRWAVAN